MQVQHVEQHPLHLPVHHHTEPTPMLYKPLRRAEPTGYAQRRVFTVARDLIALEGSAGVEAVIEQVASTMPHRHSRLHATRSLMALIEDGHLLIADDRVRMAA